MAVVVEGCHVWLKSGGCGLYLCLFLRGHVPILSY